MLLFYTLGTLFLFLFIGAFSCPLVKKKHGKVSGQIGMYIYRNKAVRGYEKYDRFGNLISKMIIHRDEGGNMIARSCFDDSGTIVRRFEYEIDKNGSMIKKTRFDQHNQISWYALYRYDANGYRIEQSNYDRQNTPASRVTFYYDSHGERIRNEVFNSTDNPIKTNIYLFDAQHRRVKDLTVDTMGEIIRTTKYIYGDSGFISRIDYMDKDGIVVEYNEVDCDARGNRLEKNDYDSNGSIQSITKYLYHT